MPLYQFYCEKCDSVFDEMVHLNGKKPPSRRKCPECNKMAKRFYAVEISAQIFGVTEQSMRRHRKYEQEGMNKEQADKFLNYSIEHSKERMEEGWRHYKPMNANVDYMLKRGMIKKDSDELSSKKLKEAEKVRQDVLQKAENTKWINPKKYKKPRK